MFGKTMKDGESAMDIKGYSYQRTLKRSLKGDYLPKCDEGHDIRKDGEKGPKAPMWDKMVTRLNKAFPYGDKTDAQLGADTTMPSENTVEGKGGDPWVPAAHERLERQRSVGQMEYGREVKKERTFNS